MLVIFFRVCFACMLLCTSRQADRLRRRLTRGSATLGTERLPLFHPLPCPLHPLLSLDSCTMTPETRCMLSLAKVKILRYVANKAKVSSPCVTPSGRFKSVHWDHDASGQSRASNGITIPPLPSAEGQTGIRGQGSGVRVSSGSHFRWICF